VTETAEETDSLLSPKARSVLRWAQSLRETAESVTHAIGRVQAEAFAGEDAVWACADGSGYLRALMIDDTALATYAIEDLEDLISDAMAEACGRGQAAGEAVLDALDTQFSVPAK
jgi:DNA-binding protein YbaB